MKPTIKWNNQLRLIISDVDETIADLYVEASPAMIRELERLLEEGKVLFLISGQSLENIRWRIVDKIKPELRKQIVVGHCSGVEVWGFGREGYPLEKPFYSLLDSSLSDQQKKKWREVIQTLVAEFKLDVFPTMPLPEFRAKAENNPLAIMLEDRGPQITFEVVNGYDLSPEQAIKLGFNIPPASGFCDLRIPILERAEVLFKKNDIPITPRLAGVFSIDFAVKGVSKTTSVKFVIENDSVLAYLGLSKQEIQEPSRIEAWGDRFTLTGGTDRHISEALPKEVRSIDFRQEDPDEFPPGYNIVLWDGQEQLHHGLLEYLKTR